MDVIRPNHAVSNSFCRPCLEDSLFDLETLRQNVVVCVEEESPTTIL
jgi:hypothetical protein